MRRSDLEHLIRAAGAISGSKRVIVIGSQAILGQFPEAAPARAVMSMEADLLPIDAPEMSDMLTGTIGELSAFHNMFGYFGDGVSMDTAVLPTGWRERLIPIDNANTNGYIGLCLEVHDLLISKYVAGRDKDREFCGAVVESGLANQDLLRIRLDATEIDPVNRSRIERWMTADFAVFNSRS